MRTRAAWAFMNPRRLESSIGALQRLPYPANGTVDRETRNGSRTSQVFPAGKDRSVLHEQTIVVDPSPRQQRELHFDAGLLFESGTDFLRQGALPATLIVANIDELIRLVLCRRRPCDGSKRKIGPDGDTRRRRPVKRT